MFIFKNRFLIKYKSFVNFRDVFPAIVFAFPNVRCPILLQVCEKDISLPIRVAEKAAEKMGDLSELITYPIDHFDIYLGDKFEKAVRLSFLKNTLLDNFN